MEGLPDPPDVETRIVELDGFRVPMVLLETQQATTHIAMAALVESVWHTWSNVDVAIELRCTLHEVVYKSMVAKPSRPQIERSWAAFLEHKLHPESPGVEPLIVRGILGTTISAHQLRGAMRNLHAKRKRTAVAAAAEAEKQLMAANQQASFARRSTRSAEVSGVQDVQVLQAAKEAAFDALRAAASADRDLMYEPDPLEVIVQVRPSIVLSSLAIIMPIHS
jgi:hypothetical protein